MSTVLSIVLDPQNLKQYYTFKLILQVYSKFQCIKHRRIHCVVNLCGVLYNNFEQREVLAYPNFCWPKTGLPSPKILEPPLKRTRLKFGDRAFSVAGPNAWNGLPVSIRFVQNTRSFKRQLKKLVF